MALAEFIVVFRESLEVAFVVGIMLAYLHSTRNSKFEKHIYLGVATGIVAALIFAYLFQFIEGGFTANEPLFEGIFMVITAVLVTWLILYIVKQKKFVEKLHSEMKARIAQNETFGLFLLAFISTLREGVEAVLFMVGIYFNSGALSLTSALLGVVAAVAMGILIFEYTIKLNINMFFKITTIVLVLLAAGLFSQGLHELQEAKILPTWIEHVYNINPPQNLDGTYPALHEKGILGGILKDLVGYDGNPSDLQVLGYLGYLGAVYFIYRRA